MSHLIIVAAFAAAAPQPTPILPTLQPLVAALMHNVSVVIPNKSTDASVSTTNATNVVVVANVTEDRLSHPSPSSPWPTTFIKGAVNLSFMGRVMHFLHVSLLILVGIVFFLVGTTLLFLPLAGIAYLCVSDGKPRRKGEGW